MVTLNGTLNQGFGQREDESLRRALQGFKVLDVNAPVGGRPVPAYFRLPEDDARLRQFPYILIDHLGISRDPDREHRGNVYYDPGYFPMGIDTDADSARGEFPIPMLARYQVATYARFQQHDMQMMVALMNGPLHPRFGAIDIIDSRDAPDDNSMRRVDVESGPEPTGARDEDGKRLFSRRWTIAVSTEFLPSEILNAQLVETVELELTQK